MMPKKYIISGNLSPRYFSARQATVENTWKNASNLEKMGHNWKKGSDHSYKGVHKNAGANQDKCNNGKNGSNLT